MIEYKCNIGNKFTEEGGIRFFPGNTIISFIDHQAPVWEEFRTIRAMLTCRDGAKCAFIMPDKSIHMTAFEGVCHEWRDPSVWTTLLPTNCTLTETDNTFAKVFREVKPLGPVTMRMDHVYLGVGSSIQLRGATDADDNELRRFRNECSQAMGIRFPNHDTYEHHITIAYFVRQPSPEQEDGLLEYQEKADRYIKQRNFTFPVRQPQLVFFNDMTDFTPVQFDRKGL